MKYEAIDRLVNSPDTYFWVRDLVDVLKRKDPVDVGNALETLAQAWNTDVDATLLRDWTTGSNLNV